MDRRRIVTLLVAMIAAIVANASAEIVDLSTVPNRKSVQLTIYNSEDLTLVRETRKVTFKPGANPLQFSWANTLIDPTSVELRFLTHGDKLSLLDATFPHVKPQMVYWNIQSEMDGEATIEITYFTSGISWSADYLCTVNPAETLMGLDGFVRVQNNSGEEYEDAQVRLVVGRINLVQKIAELARITPQQVNELGDQVRMEFKKDALKEALFADAKMPEKPCEESKPDIKAKQVAKEGLGEYFIYTIEGAETIRNGWAKRMRSLEAAKVPFKIQYRYRPAEYGDQLVRMYLLKNDKDSMLGSTPLPDGVVRVFRENGRDGLTFLTAQPIKYVPVGDKIELNLGVDPEVIFELIKLRTSRDDIWLQINGANLYRRADQPGVQVEVNSAVAGWDDRTVYTQRVRNYTTKAIDLEIRRTFPGHVAFRSELKAKNHDFQTVEYTATVNAAEKRDLLYEIVQRQGHNAKQNNVTVESANIKP